MEQLPTDTVDGYICGNPEILITGVAITFLATIEHCYKAYQHNCNIIISHEGIWYHHKEQQLDVIGHATKDPVYFKKKAFFQEQGITLYRYHDGIHKALPDRITAGLIKTLGWTHKEIAQFPAYSIVELDGTLGSLIQYIKDTLHLPWVRYIGKKEQPIGRVLVAVGYRGNGSLLLPIIAKEKIDLVIYGEGPEWEIPEYCRDAQTLNLGTALIILGHGASESPGMELLADELRAQFQDIPIYYFPFQNPFLVG
ncbi:Nif3-like dinuclear metal center hexameric protein [Gracilinema caldarium]|nr:Nif3-like dinuclear metal center hexameric protein [Gracilinema caldarium]